MFKLFLAFFFIIMPQILNLVKQLNDIGLRSVESEIQDIGNQFCSLILENILKDNKEPITENTIVVNKIEFRYAGDDPLTLKSRFGTYQTITRRIYYEWDKTNHCFKKAGKRLVPSDEHLGLVPGSHFTPGLGYLCTLYGADDPYSPSAEKLKQTLQISLSSSGIQSTTERIGDNLRAMPQDLIPALAESEPSACMAVSVDATGLPRISDEPNKGEGREHLRNPTECKMTTVVKIEKYLSQLGRRETVQTAMPRAEVSYTGACLGDNGFDEVRNYVRLMGELSGQFKTKLGVFLSDGQRSNWGLANDYFHTFIQILDIRHAQEHLSDFYHSLKVSLEEKDKETTLYDEWNKMLMQGEVVDLLGELERIASNRKWFKAGHQKEAEEQLGYFRHNQDRMKYDEYLALGLPIASGTVESACKQVIGNRFKKQGMRWNKEDSQKVLNARLHSLNGTLEKAFVPRPVNWELPKPA